MTLLADPRQVDDIVLQTMLRMRARDLPARPPRLDPEPIEASWGPWLRALFARYLRNTRGEPVPFAVHHAEFWDWLWAVRPGEYSPPFIAVWPRGGAKSTNAEMACVALGAWKRRRYGLYICETQEQADDHVGNVGAMLESREIADYYPAMADRAVGKFGNAKGWRRDRLRTASGFTIDAIGLDTAARGVKLDEARPDFMVIDDADDKLDSKDTVSKKLTLLRETLLPAGSEDLVVLVAQNLVHGEGIVAQLVDGRADFLVGRIVSGPHKALRDAAFEQARGQWVIVAGSPTWEGQDLQRCQALMDRIGYSSFLSECQHEVQEPAGSMFSHLVYKHCEPGQVPQLQRVVVWVDPAVTDTDQSDAQGIQIDGLGGDGKVYRLWSWEGRTSPLNALRLAIEKAVEFKAEAVGVETDQGGDTWQSVYREACQSWIGEGGPGGTPLPKFRSDKAGAGHGPKTHRASLMLADYERGRFIHVLGTHALLERALRRFPLKKPFDLVDAAYWSWQDLAKPDTAKGLADMIRGGGQRITVNPGIEPVPTVREKGDFLGLFTR